MASGREAARALVRLVAGTEGILFSEALAKPLVAGRAAAEDGIAWKG